MTCGRYIRYIILLFIYYITRTRLKIIFRKCFTARNGIISLTIRLKWVLRVWGNFRENCVNNLGEYYRRLYI